MNKIVVICGFSGCGKDTITNIITGDIGYNKVISTTSRPIRLGESEGDPYYFVSREEFEKMLGNGEFIECRKYHATIDGVKNIWYYGIHKKDMDISECSYVVVLDMLGLIEVKKQFGDSVVSFFIDVPEETRRLRAITGRPDFDLKEWERRYEDDKTQFPMEMIEREVDYIIPNVDLESCVNEIVSKIRK